jgi:hypothetical protein
MQARSVGRLISYSLSVARTHRLVSFGPCHVELCDSHTISAFLALDQGEFYERAEHTKLAVHSLYYDLRNY